MVLGTVRAVAQWPVTQVKGAYAKAENSVGHGAHATYATNMRGRAVVNAAEGNFLQRHLLAPIQGVASAVIGLLEGSAKSVKNLTWDVITNAFSPKTAFGKLVEGVKTLATTILNTVAMTGLSALALVFPKTSMGVVHNPAPAAPAAPVVVEEVAAEEVAAEEDAAEVAAEEPVASDTASEADSEVDTTVAATVKGHPREAAKVANQRLSEQAGAA